LNNVTWRLFLPKLREFSKINSHSYQKRETPELEGALEQFFPIFLPSPPNKRGKLVTRHLSEIRT